jgi:hypothetical protein
MHLVRRALPGADLMRRADEVMLRCMSPDAAPNGHAAAVASCLLLGGRTDLARIRPEV